MRKVHCLQQTSNNKLPLTIFAFTQRKAPKLVHPERNGIYSDWSNWSNCLMRRVCVYLPCIVFSVEFRFIFHCWTVRVLYTIHQTQSSTYLISLHQVYGSLQLRIFILFGFSTCWSVRAPVSFVCSLSFGPWIWCNTMLPCGKRVYRVRQVLPLTLTQILTSIT